MAWNDGIFSLIGPLTNEPPPNELVKLLTRFRCDPVKCLNGFGAGGPDRCGWICFCFKLAANLPGRLCNACSRNDGPFVFIFRHQSFGFWQHTTGGSWMPAKWLSTGRKLTYFLWRLQMPDVQRMARNISTLIATGVESEVKRGRDSLESVAFEVQRAIGNTLPRVKEQLRAAGKWWSFCSSVVLFT